MKNYQASAWKQGTDIGSVETCKGCSMRVIKYRESSTTHYASWLGGRHVRDKDGNERELPEGTDVVWIRDFGGNKMMEGL